MYCDKCGTNNIEGIEFCEKCGMKIEENNAEVPDGFVEKDNSRSVKIFASAIACVAVVALLFWCISGFISCMTEGAAEKPVENYIRAVNDVNVDYLFKNINNSHREVIEGSESAKRIMKDSIETKKQQDKEIYGDNVKVSYRIVDKIKHKNDKLKDFEKQVNDQIKIVNERAEKVDIKSAYTYMVKLNYKGDKKKKSEYATISVYKMDGKWYSTYGINYSNFYNS